MQPNSSSIIRRWVCGSLLITVLVLVLAEGLFLYYSYNDLYGGVEPAGHRHGGGYGRHRRKPRAGPAPRG